LGSPKARLVISVVPEVETEIVRWGGRQFMGLPQDTHKVKKLIIISCSP